MADGLEHISVAARAEMDRAIRERRWREIAAHLQSAIEMANDADMVERLGQALCGTIDILSLGPPVAVYMEQMREEAGAWCDAATPVEVECYVAAGLRRIERTSFAPAARKRLFVALWESMGTNERRRFLSRVDPEGQFVRRAS